MFNFLRRYQTILQSTYTMLHFHQECMRFLISSPTLVVHLFYYSHSSEYGVIFPCGFDLHSPKN